MKTIAKLTVFLLLFLVPSTSHAKLTLHEFLVGGAIKNLAKLYVKTSNLPKLKTKYIKKIATMKEEKFRKNFNKFFVVYKQLPDPLKEKYAFHERTSKSEVIDLIDHVKKNELIAIINQIPSDFIVQQTRRYTPQPQANGPEEHGPGNEMMLWKRLIQKV